MPGLTFLSPPVSEGGFGATDAASGSPGDDVGPMADTTPPAFREFNRTPDHPGPTSIVNVSAGVADEDNNLVVKLQYGYDNATWTTKNAAKVGSSASVETFTDRNPASGTTQSRMQKTYSPDREIVYLNVRIWSEDHDTCWLRVRGYVGSTSTWENIYYSTRTGDGTKVNTHFVNKGYTRWSIDYYDTENNDDLYYNCTYKVRDITYAADIPAAGTQSKVYYRFNATDSGNNWALSDTLNYTVDTTPPQIKDFTKPASVARRSDNLPIYTNVTDPTGVVSAYVNWSTDDYSTWSHVTMSRSSGNYTDAEFMGGIPPPSKNTTVWIRIGAYDEGSNHNNTTSYNFTWNPPPTIKDVRTDPAHPNHQVMVNLSAIVSDADGVANVTLNYSLDGSSWTSLVMNKTTTRYWVYMKAGLGNPWVHFKFWAKDTKGGWNETSTYFYYVDKSKPRIYTPSYEPQYPNASHPVWVAVPVTDYVGLASVKLIYSLDGGGNWSTSLMSKTSDVTNLTTAGYSYQYYSDRVTALRTVGSLVGTWDSSVSGYSGSPPAGFWTDNDVLFLDGDGYSYQYSNAITAARAGKMMVVNADTWSSIRSSLSNPTYTSYVSHGFTTYGFSLGRGAVLMTYSLANNDNMGYSYHNLNATNQAKLAEHLLGCHDNFMPYSGQIPKTTTSMKVLYKINATDLSNLSTVSSNYEYTTDDTPPSYLEWAAPPTPAAWDQTRTFPVYAKVKDDMGLGYVILHYSLDGGATWSSRTMSKSSGNDTEANYTSSIPSTGSSSWVNYYYQAYDRSGNSARTPSSGVFSYQTSDAPSFSSLTNSPTLGNLVSPVRVTATIIDPDVVSLARGHYRFGSSGAYTEVNCTAGTNDRWYVDIPAPTSSGTMYYYFTARDTIGVWATSSTSNYYVDGTLPTVKMGDRTPLHPSATSAVDVDGTVHDDRGTVTATFQYKYGPSGTVANMTFTGVGGTFHSDRNPSSGTTRYTLSRYYYMTLELGYLNLYIHSSDNDTIWIRVRAYNPSSGWTNLYYNTYDCNGTKIDKNYAGMGYTRFQVYMYEQYDGDGTDYIYYKVSYTDGNPYVNATIPGPGYSTWVYYRLSATDGAGNTNSTVWSRYWADGTIPTMTVHKAPSSKPAGSPVTLNANFWDDHAIDRAVIHYSFGGSYRTKAMTAGSKNATHLTATGAVAASLLPLKVTYFFRVYDKAGNHNDSQSFTYDTYLATVAEGVAKTYDASNLYSSVGYSQYEWDFDHSGTFNVDATGKSRSHPYMDDGNYTIALRLTDNNDVVTTMTFQQKVTDLGPSAKIIGILSPYEGKDLLMNGSTSSSYPDALAKYEWDLDYDGVTFDVDATGSTTPVVYMDNGTYYVALRVTDDDGSTDMAVVILDIKDRNPVIECDPPTAVNEGEIFTLDARNTTSWPDALDRFEWDLDHDWATFDIDATGNLTTHTYMDDGLYTILLRVYDDDGSYDEFFTNIRVWDLAPTANISSPSTVNEGEVFTLNGSGSTSYPDDIVSWQWDLDFTGTFRADVDNVSYDHTYMDHGNYTIALRVTDDDGTRHLVTWSITVRDLAPLTTFQIPASINEGETITLDASGSSSYPDLIIRYEWDLQYTDDFTVDLTGVKAEHTFTVDGTYIIALRVTDDDGSMTIASIPLEVKDLAPVANYTITGDLVEGSPVTIDARASVSWPDSMVSWMWNMDQDGEPVLLNGSVVTHTYMDDGEYTVRLTLTDSDGSQTEVLISIGIADLGPTARLYPDGGGPGLMAEGDTLSLDASILSTSYPDELVAYEWWWEADGEVTMSEDNATLYFTFHSPGDHVIYLLVRDDDGSESVTNVTVSIINVGPTAHLTAGDAPEGDPVLFNASGCYEPGMDLAIFRWNLDGDATWDAETDVPLLEHVWYIPGMYQVRMEVEDEDGSTARIIITVIVTDVVPVADAGGPYEVEEGEELTLDASGSFEPGDHIVDYAWDMNGDGLFDISGADAFAAWSWTIAGSYVASLTVTDAEGNLDEVRANVTVLDLPPTFSFVLPDVVEEAVTYAFAIEDLADPGTVTFEVVWTFGDGASIEGQNVTHAYDEDGTYEGSITILDNDGARHTFPFPSIVVTNVPPRIILDSDYIRITEDEPFEYQVPAQDTHMDTMTYDFEGPGGKMDPDTGIFSWTPLDEDVGTNSFTFIVTDEDGGRSEVDIILDVEDVDNDFIGGMSTAGGSALILAVILAVIIVAVLYMKARGGGGLEDDDETPGEETVVDVPPAPEPETAPVMAPLATPAVAAVPVAAVAPAVAAAPAVEEDQAPPPEPMATLEAVLLPDGPSTTEGASAASSEAVSGDADQIPPPPPPPPPAGPQFNKLLEDKANEAELKTEEETEPDHASEWEVID